MCSNNPAFLIYIASVHAGLEAHSSAAIGIIDMPPINSISFVRNKAPWLLLPPVLPLRAFSPFLSPLLLVLPPPPAITHKDTQVQASHSK